MAALSAAIVCASVAAQQSPAEPHARLAFFEGEWTTDNAAPEADFRETCSWMAGGRRHMLCRSRWKVDGQAREALSIFSFDNAAGEYSYHGFRAGGSVVVLRGSFADGAWRLASERGQGAERQRVLVTIEPSPGGFTLTERGAAGDAELTVRTRIHYKRLAP